MNCRQGGMRVVRGCGSHVGKGALEPGKGRWVVPKAAEGASNPNTGPEPGSTRKGTARDARKLAQIFGPSRYPAFVPDESLMGPSIPLPPNVTPTEEPAPRPGPGFGTSLRMNGSSQAKSTPLLRKAMKPSEVRPALEKATHWKDLEAVLAQGSALGAQNLLMVADKLSGLALAESPTSEAEQKQLQQLGKQLVTATRPHISTTYTLDQISLVMRATILTGFAPSENWLFAAEMVALSSMQEMQMQQAARQEAAAQAAASPGAAPAFTPDQLQAAVANEVELAKVLLGFCTYLLEVGYTPRDSWISVLVNCLHPVLRQLAGAAGAHMQAEDAAARAGPDIRKASTKGLIVMPEQVQPDQVTTADGEQVTLDATPTPPPTWDAVPQFGSIEWATLSQLLMTWEPEGVTDTWKQTYLEASYGALVATGRVVSQELQDGPAPDAPPLTSRVLHATVQADVATCLLLLGVKPDARWLSSLGAASAAVFQRVLSDETLGESGLLTHPAAVTNLLVVMRQCEVPIDQAWVESGLMAAARDPGRAAGDQLAALLIEICKLDIQLSEAALGAAVALAEKAGPLWEDQAQIDRMLQQKRQQAGGSGAGVEPVAGKQDVTGFTAGGLVGLLYALTHLGALDKMQPNWIQGWGDHAVKVVDDMDVQGMLLSLQQAAEGGVLLPVRTIHTLGGKLLQMLHKQVAGDKADAATTSGDSADEIEGLPCADVYRALLSGLGSQPTELPAAWLPQMQDLTLRYLDKFSPAQVLDAMQVMGLAAEPVEPSFVMTLLRYYESHGGLTTPDGCAAMSTSLQAVAAEAEAFKVVEDAQLKLVAAPDAPVNLGHWRDMLLSMATGGHVPAPEFWGQLQAATQDVKQLTVADLANFMSAYGALRALRQDAVGDLGLSWATGLSTETLSRLPSCSNQDEYMALLSSLGALLQGGVVFSSAECGVMEQASLQFGSSLMPAVVSSCCIIFASCEHTPSGDWYKCVASAMHAGLDTAEAEDTILFIKGVGTLPGMKEAMPSALMKRVMEHAGRLAATNTLRPSNLVSFLSAANELRDVGGVGGATPAMSAILERALSVRALLHPAEVTELIRSVFGLGVRPQPRWLSLMLSRLEQGDIAEAGPQGITTIASCLLATNTPAPPGLLNQLVAVVPKMTGLAVQALAALDEAVSGNSDIPAQEIIPQLDQLTTSSVQLMHSLTNLLATVPPQERKSFAGEGFQVWRDVAQLMDRGIVPPELHDSVLYAAARTTSRSAAFDPTVDSPASILAEAAAKCTTEHLPTYSSNQLLTIFCTMSSMHMPLPAWWVERFWEYSRSKLSGAPAELLVGCVTGMATVGLTPPSLWEEALLTALSDVIPKLGVQDVHSVVLGLARCGIRPPSDTVQRLLDAALSRQQVSAARLEAVHKSSSPAGGVKTGVAAAADLAVSSTRAGRRRGAVPPPPPRKAGPAAGGVADQAAVRAAAMACAQEMKLSIDLVRQVQTQFGYQPDSLWLAQWQEAVGVALNSPHVPGEDRVQATEQVRLVLRSQQ